MCVVVVGSLWSLFSGSLRWAVARAVHWAGRVDWDRPRYYASADVFCTPCQKASFGMVLLEAMSRGRPVVASRISGFQLLVQDGSEGLLVDPPDDPVPFASTIGHLLDTPAERVRMGAEGRHTATTRYSWHRVAAELETYYSELRGDRPSPLWRSDEPLPRESATAPGAAPTQRVV